jgi:hypothetical protein
MRGVLILLVLNAVLFYSFWGKWDILFLMSGAFYYTYKRFLIDYADRLLK